MSKSITLEIQESDAAQLETALDNLLTVLRRLDAEGDERWQEINRLKAETHVMMEQINRTLNVNVEKAL